MFHLKYLKPVPEVWCTVLLHRVPQIQVPQVHWIEKIVYFKKIKRTNPATKTNQSARPMRRREVIAPDLET